MDMMPNASASTATLAVDRLARDISSARDSMLQEDSALMLRYARGDVHAFEALYARHKGALYRYLQRMCRQRETVNDLFQEVWSKLIATRERYEARAQFTTFLFHIAHNCAMDHFRRNERRAADRTEDVVELQDSLASDDAERPETHASAAELQGAFERALEQLPDEQRNVFVLREETGMSLEEIGNVTGVTMETAKSRLRYALVKLRAALKQYEPEHAKSS